MKEFNTSKRDYFRTQQTIYTSSNPRYNNTYDLEVAVLATKLSKDYETVNVPSDWRDYFSGQGYSDAYSTNLSTLWFRWLGEQGFTNINLRQRFKEFYDDGTVDL